MKLVGYRGTILSMISSFEEKFFFRYQESLYQGLSPYLENLYGLETSFLEAMKKNPDNKSFSLRYQQAHQQIEIIESILRATSLDEIMKLIPPYLYLKQALE